MANQGKPHEIDILADVLTKLGNIECNEIKEEDAKDAKQKYNQLVADLAYYKKEHDKKNSTENDRSERRYIAKIKELQDELKSRDNKISELERRLSSMMGHKIKSGNPEIADLSDQNRPTKLSENFRSLYDDEWTSAYEEIEKTGKIKDEEGLIGVLAEVVKAADEFCDEARSQQTDGMYSVLKDDLTNPKVPMGGTKRLQTGEQSELDENQEKMLKKMLIEIQKEFADVAVRPLSKIFYDGQLKKLLDAKKLPVSSPKMNSFVVKLLRIVWMMKIQDPPMHLVWQKKGEETSQEKFTFYTKRGDVVAFCVWPVVFLHKDGPLMSKGVLQAK